MTLHMDQTERRKLGGKPNEWCARENTWKWRAKRKHTPPTLSAHVHVSNSSYCFIPSSLLGHTNPKHPVPTCVFRRTADLERTNTSSTRTYIHLKKTRTKTHDTNTENKMQTHTKKNMVVYQKSNSTHRICLHRSIENGWSLVGIIHSSGTHGILKKIIKVAITQRHLHMTTRLPVPAPVSLLRVV